MFLSIAASVRLALVTKATVPSATAHFAWTEAVGAESVIVLSHS